MDDRDVVLITGASRGIGRFLAEHFARRGACVIGCSRKPADWTHAGVTHYCADVTSEPAIRDVFKAIQREHGRLDITINNAGIASMNHSLLTPLASVERILATNVTGTFLVSRESAKIMQRRRFGRIVNLTTVAVPMRLAGEAVYAASKGAVEMLTRVMAHELGEFGITCNAVGPSPVDTDLIRGVPADKIDQITQRLAVKRHGRYEDVAHVIDFFVHPESGYVTGQVLYLGGVS
jgi:3-oxoacyl-[acyl-carrier protein] reductase